MLKLITFTVAAPPSPPAPPPLVCSIRCEVCSYECYPFWHWFSHSFVCLCYPKRRLALALPVTRSRANRRQNDKLQTKWAWWGVRKLWVSLLSLNCNNSVARRPSTRFTLAPVQFRNETGFKLTLSKLHRCSGIRVKCRATFYIDGCNEIYIHRRQRAID